MSNKNITSVHQTADNNLYLLQVDKNTNSEIIESVHWLINSVQQTKTESLFLPLVESRVCEGQRQLQLCIDPKAVQYSTSTQETQDDQQVFLPQQIQHQPIELASTLLVEGRDNVSKENILTNKINVAVVEPKEKVERIQNYVHIPDRVVPPKAIAVLPIALQLRLNCVSPRRTLATRVRFGPLRGVINKILPSQINELVAAAAASNLPIYLCKKSTASVCHIDMSDYDKSNWLTLLPLGSQTTANVWLYEDNGELYGITTKSLPSRTPLMIGYSKKYAEEYNLPTNQPILDIHEAVQPGDRQWWCSKCDRTLSSHSQLLHHSKVCHKDGLPRPRRYRCSGCTRTFARLFSLKRHNISKTCSKTPEKLEVTSTAVETNKGIGSCSTPNAEDSRLPSDESFNNYSQGLDFSINLFDTDRMPNLDISGSSRSENEYNPFASGFKDDSTFINEAAFPDGSINLNHTSKSDSKSPNKSIEKVTISCPYCKSPILKEKYRQHFRECPSRRYECQCGKVFYNKEQMVEHIYVDHKEDIEGTPVDKSELQPSTESQYRCEECKLDFKDEDVVNFKIEKNPRTCPRTSRDT